MLIHPSTGKGIKIDDSTVKATGSYHTARLHGNQATTTDESHESRRLETGHDWLDNNGVNLLMAATMSVGAMGIAQWFWNVDVSELLL